MDNDSSGDDTGNPHFTFYVSHAAVLKETHVRVRRRILRL